MNPKAIAYIAALGCLAGSIGELAARDQGKCRTVCTCTSNGHTGKTCQMTMICN